MVDIPDSLQSLFTAPVEEDDSRYVIEIPKSEVRHDAIEVAETYKVAVLGEDETSVDRAPASHQSTDSESTYQTPPVDEGERRQVTIESLGDKGDGIAKVERGYVLIVPGARPGDEVTVEIEEVRENVAFAEPVTEDTPR